MTTHTGHTPGKWYEMTKGENHYQSAICQESTGKTVALTYTSNDKDAALIAAAPELLKSVQRMHRWFVHHEGMLQDLEQWDDEEQDLIEEAVTAIARAEGRGV